MQELGSNATPNGISSSPSTPRYRPGRTSRTPFLVLISGMLVVSIWNMHKNAQLGNFLRIDEQIRLSATTQPENLQVEEVQESSSSDAPFSAVSIILFLLLTLQCGCQPILVKFFMPEGVVRSTCVMGQEVSKFAMSIGFLLSSGKWNEAVSGWTAESAFLAAGVPAILFTTQTYLNLMANQVLPPVTFSVLNQTKTLSTALCCFIILNKSQSTLQVFALLLLVVAALVNQKILPIPCGRKAVEEDDVVEDTGNSQSKSKPEDDARQLIKGVIPALFASFLSGLAGALTQKTLTFHSRSPHLFNLELAFFSTCFVLITLLLGSPDYKQIKTGGFLQGWSWKTLIPIMTNAAGGILVGLVTKHLGAVVKGFSVIFGMIVSGILQQLLLSSNGEGVTWAQFLSGVIGAVSLWLHASFPPA